MAEKDPIDLSACEKFGMEREIRPVDQTFLKLTVHGGATEAFQRYGRHALHPGQHPDREGMTPALHTAAAIGAMIVRAQAGLDTAQNDFSYYNGDIARIAAGKGGGGGLVRTMNSSIASDVEGAGSIVAVLLSTNAVDDKARFSIWKNTPPTRIADRLFGSKNTSQGSNAEVWTRNASNDTTGPLNAYLSREHSLKTPDTTVSLAGGYGAVMLRSGALRRAYIGSGNNKTTAIRQVEDFVNAMARVARGQGDQGTIAALGRPEWLKYYYLGRALLEENGAKPRSNSGFFDGVAQAAKTVRGATQKTSVKFDGRRPTGVAKSDGPSEPKEFEEPGQFVDRGAPGKKIVGGAIDRSKRPGDPTPPTTASRRPQMTTPRSVDTAMKGQTPDRKPVSAAVNARRPLAVMLTDNLDDLIMQARRAKMEFTRWPELFAAINIKGAAGKSSAAERALAADSRVNRLAWRQLTDRETFDRLATPEAPVTAEEFAATTQVRRWLTQIVKFNQTKDGISPEHARRAALKIREAQDAHLKRNFGIPEAMGLTPRLREVLTELRTAELSQVLVEPQRHANAFFMLADRVKRAFTGGYDDLTLPADTARVMWKRVDTMTGGGRKFDVDELPDRAREVYERLAKQAGRFGLPAYFR